MNGSITRPHTPMKFITSDNWQLYTRQIPANEVHEWINRKIPSDAGNIHNPNHGHLLETDLCFMWASDSFAKKDCYVLGQAEQVMLRASGGQKARMEQQMYEWFGRIPKFIITQAAKFNKETGWPVLILRGHDVERFTGVVRRYGASKEVLELVNASNAPAEVTHLDIAKSCGTYMLKLA